MLARSRGILDTSTVILLPRLSDPDVLPVEPYITAGRFSFYHGDRRELMVANKESARK